MRELLFGRPTEGLSIPPLPELTGALTALARGHRHKALLPLLDRPAELALVRHGAQVLVSHYGTDSAPEVALLDRPVSLRRALDVCARATLEGARLDPDPTGRQLAVRVAERAMRATVTEDATVPTTIARQGGALGAPSEDVGLAFGFDARLSPGAGAVSGTSARADVHALLFEGTLWAWVRGRRLTLARGPILLAVQRMVAATRALVDAWESGRAVNLRLRVGGFHIGMRLDVHGEVTVSLGSPEGTATAAALDVPAAALPILRLASDLLRAVVSVDRGQSRNLRLSAMRDEVRTLRRTVRAREQSEGFVNDDPDRLRVSSPPPRAEAPDSPLLSSSGSLRFGERWRVAVDGLDAGATFFCGDRLVLATPQHTLAVGRDDGEVLWARDSGGAQALMAGSVLLRLFPDGAVELCDVADGEPFATARITPRVTGQSFGVVSGGGALPPLAILPEASNRLVALDLRTGEPRWRFSARGRGVPRLRRHGRILLVTSGAGALTALDIVTGEVCWRYTTRRKLSMRPAVCRDTAVVVSGDPSARHAVAYGIDVFTGEPLWERDVPGGPAAAPASAGPVVILPTRAGRLIAVDPDDGRALWDAEDPGLGDGGAALTVDRSLLINAPSGCLSAVDLGDGETRWTRSLSDPLADDVPRRLEPVLRGGALFVPAASVHIVRPGTGATMTESLPCDLVPDILRVDERGWIYVAEESGHVGAYAPIPHLTLIRGGR